MEEDAVAYFANDICNNLFSPLAILCCTSYKEMEMVKNSPIKEAAESMALVPSSSIPILRK
jgi:hypothetical protein